MNIFDQITAAAAEGAAVGAQAFARPAGFDGMRTEASEGFALPVAPVTKVLYGYQMAAVESILTYRRIVLGYQPGLGKTAIMMAAMAAEAQAGRKSIILVSPSLRVSPWAQDFAADYPGLKIAMPTTGKAAAFDPEADVVILPNSILYKRMDDVLAWGAHNVFVDEAHDYKNRTAQRSKALVELCDTLADDAIVVTATGTLVSNNIIDVYNPMRATGKANATAVSGGYSWTRFMDRWCEVDWKPNGRGGKVKVATGCRDEVGLRQALTSSCYLSVPREEVLDLPERTTAVRALVLNGDAVEYRRAEKQFLAWIREVKGDAAYRRAAKAEAITRLMALWEMDGKAKVKAATEYITSLTGQGEQVVVFAHHRTVVERLYSAFLSEGLRVGTIIGGMSSDAKAEVVDAFQAGRLDVVLGNIQAAGTGLTLHAARHAVFVQLPWAPGVYGQAADRVYRIGQTRHVTTHVLNMNEGVSEHLWAVLVEKARVADAINTGTPTTIDPGSVEELVLQSYGW